MVGWMQNFTVCSELACGVVYWVNVGFGSGATLGQIGLLPGLWS